MPIIDGYQPRDSRDKPKPYWLASPCACGYSMEDNDTGTVKSCRACGRRMEIRDWGWAQVTPLQEIREVELCNHARCAVGLIGPEPCPYCPDGKAEVSDVR